MPKIEIGLKIALSLAVTFRANTCLFQALFLVIFCSPMTIFGAENHSIPHWWSDVPANHFDGNKFLGMPEPQKSLPQNNPMTLFLQGKLDIIWSHLLDTGQISENIPKPNVVLLESFAYNGYVTAVSRCIDIEGSIKGATPGANPESKALDLRSHRTPYIQNTDFESCFANDNPQSIEPLLQYWTQNAQPNCEWSVEGGIFTISKDCFLDIWEGEADNIKFSKVFYTSTANIIHLGIGYINGRSLEEVLAFLIHELGHYVKAHGSPGISEKLSYFYKDQPRESNKRPIRSSPQDQKIGKKALEVGDYPLFNEQFLEAQYHPILSSIYDVVLSAIRFKPRAVRVRNEIGAYFAEEKIVKNGGTFSNGFFEEDLQLGMENVCGSNKECETSCSTAARQIGEDFWFSAFLGRFNDQVVPTDTDLRMYKENESRVLSCIDSIGTGKGTPRNSRTYVYYLMDLSGLSLESEETQGKTVRELLEVLNAPAHENQSAFEGFLNSDLKIFTSEQEADEFAVDILRQFGISHDPVVNFLFSLQEPKDAFVDSLLERYGRSVPRRMGFVEHSKCLEYYENQWRVGDQPIKIPINDLSDPHLPGCYRPYSADQYGKTSTTLHKAEKSLIRDGDKPQFERALSALPEIPPLEFKIEE